MTNLFILELKNKLKYLIHAPGLRSAQNESFRVFQNEVKMIYPIVEAVNFSCVEYLYGKDEQ